MSTSKEKLNRFRNYSLSEKIRYIYRFVRRRLSEIGDKLFYNRFTLSIFYTINNKKLEKRDKEIDFEVDAVYMWVDGNDPKIREKRLKYLKLENKELNIEAVTEGRFYDNDELKYSLRSLGKYAPWVRKIYLITDDQLPKWFKDNPKITIVDHKDIIDEKYLPTFNSEVIDFNIHKIKGLADRFILINDDMFFDRKVYKSFFFTKEGVPIKYLRRINHKRIYQPSSGMFFDIYKKCQRMIEAKLKEIPATRFAHCITPYRKDSFQKTIDLFPEAVERTLNSRFRKEHDVSRFLVDFYEIAVLGAPIFNVSKYKNVYNVVVDMRPDTRYKFSIIEKQRPYMFCLNDNQETTNEDRKICREFLERVLSEESSFEK